MTREALQSFAFALAVAAAVATWLVLRQTPPDPPGRTPLSIPLEEVLHGDGGWIDVSPDGALVVYRREAGNGGSELWVRSLDEQRGSPIAGTDDAMLPAISPDGAKVAFVEDASPARVRVAPIPGGPARTVAEAALAGPARWSPDGTWIYFTAADSGLVRVPAVGGAAQVVTAASRESGEVHWMGDVLPDGRTILYTSTVATADDPRIEALDLESGEVRYLWSGRSPRLGPVGNLLYLDAVEPVLMALPLDPRGLEVAGTPVRVAVPVSTARGWPVYAVSGSTLVYGAPVGVSRVTPVWVERDGTERPVDAGWYFRALPVYTSLALSPADDRLAASIPDDSGAWHLWIKALGSGGGPPTRLTSDGSMNYRPTWLPGGRALTYLSDRAGQSDLWRTDVATDDEEAVRLVDGEDVVRNGVLSPAGDWIVYREGEAPIADIFTAPVASPERRTPLAATDAGERSPELSHDGRWVAYTTNASGRWEVWVTDVQEPTSGSVRVSRAGGEEPRWAHRGRELFYRNLDNELVVVPVAVEAPLRLGEPRVLFSMEPYLGSDGRAQYDVGADDDRFVMLRLLDGGDVGLVRIHDFEVWLQLQR